jgi:hypothetical protein
MTPVDCTNTIARAKRISFVLLAIVLIICFAWWSLWSGPFSKTTLKKLSPGMSEAQVHDILGTALQTNRAAGSGGPEIWWIYQHRYFPSFAALIVEFDKSGHLITYVCD